MFIKHSTSTQLTPKLDTATTCIHISSPLPPHNPSICSRKFVRTNSHDNQRLSLADVMLLIDCLRRKPKPQFLKLKKENRAQLSFHPVFGLFWRPSIPHLSHRHSRTHTPFAWHTTTRGDNWTKICIIMLRQHEKPRWCYYHSLAWERCPTH